ncbi:hypothetical protein [Chryseobacterium sp.]|uniref:hypothetical protein n=1 Tax=Chryseobacterium sp. TaxID=1871047 RepID=UPI001B101739|nr:hypothetical protein [Chryseobacterium sp.]MBO9692268.1 hypothetical protein [Chryseobacterium sp.]
MNKSEEKTSNPLPKNKKWTPWTIAITIIGLVGLFSLFHGIGYSKYKDSLDFKAGYFVIGILILAPVYYYIYSIIESEKGFPLENFNKDLIIQDIKRYKICGQVDLRNAMIENFVFGVGKDQNDYVNISYNKTGIEFIKTKITVEYTEENSIRRLLTAYTNVDKITLKEIFKNQYSSTTVYFDKYIPGNYYLDLEFLQNWKK